MDTKVQVFIAVAITVIATLYQIECDTSRWKSVKVGKVGGSPTNLARFISNPDNTNKWFRWISEFKEANSRPLGVGKKYESSYDVPIIGKYKMLFTLVEYEPDHWFALESEYLFKPRITILLKDAGENITQIVISLEFRRSSALYQWTLGPLLWFLGDQQIKASLFMLRMFFPF